ncbi:aminoglycoside adenylyltransferase domain-containing protein [Thalassobacillus hwangdonensis]|uniref:Spectinomycin 9-adenylyltransferase n=1 Tax=Thalassobacillus hwangdonensis TaxID=546108 RepID=A0ABW3L0M2_9BACI
MIDWKTCPDNTRYFINEICNKITALLGQDFVGCYLHGSLAMGGFHPAKSDVDLLFVSKRPLSLETKQELTALMLGHSANPHPIELHVLTTEQLQSWQHPSSFDYHFSEGWRKKYEADSKLDISHLKDPDLAAHLMVTRHRGITLAGKAIEAVIPEIPQANYLDAILYDFNSCMEAITEDPVYSTLNMVRVWGYIKNEAILSKYEAGEWGSKTLSSPHSSTVEQAFNTYLNGEAATIAVPELIEFKDFINEKIETYIKAKEIRR